MNNNVKENLLSDLKKLNNLKMQIESSLNKSLSDNDRENIYLHRYNLIDCLESMEYFKTLLRKKDVFSNKKIRELSLNKELHLELLGEFKYENIIINQSENILTDMSLDILNYFNLKELNFKYKEFTKEYDSNEYLDVLYSFINDFDKESYNFFKDVIDNKTIYNIKGTQSYLFVESLLDKIYIALTEDKEQIKMINLLPHELGHASVYKTPKDYIKDENANDMFKEVPAYYYELSFLNYIKDHNLYSDAYSIAVENNYYDLISSVIYFKKETNKEFIKKYNHLDKYLSTLQLYENDPSEFRLYGTGIVISLYLSQDKSLYEEFMNKYYYNNEDFETSKMKEDILSFNFKTLIQNKELILRSKL